MPSVIETVSGMIASVRKAGIDCRTSSHSTCFSEVAITAPIRISTGAITG